MSWTIHFLYFFTFKEAAPLFGVFVKILFSMVVNYFDWVPTEKILIVTPGVFLLLTSPKDLPPRWTAQAIPSSPVKQPTKHVIITLIDLSDIWNKQKIVALHLWYMFLSRPTLICSLIAAHPWRTTCNKRSFDQQKQKFFRSTKAKVFFINKSKSFCQTQVATTSGGGKASMFPLTLTLRSRKGWKSSETKYLTVDKEGRSARTRGNLKECWLLELNSGDKSTVFDWISNRSKPWKQVVVHENHL